MKLHLLFLLLMLGACSAMSPAPVTPVDARDAQESKSAPVICPVVVPPAPVAVGNELSELLDYYQRARHMTPAELTKEQLTTAQALAVDRTDKLQLQQALLFSLSRSTSDINRALNLVESVMNNKGADSASFRPLATLLWVQLNEQKRSSEQSEKMQTLLKEEQKRSAALQERFDAAQQKLEGLKAIEKSLINRPQGTKP